MPRFEAVGTTTNSMVSGHRRRASDRVDLVKMVRDIARTMRSRFTRDRSIRNGTVTARTRRATDHGAVPRLLILGALLGSAAPLAADVGSSRPSAAETPDGRADWRLPASRVTSGAGARSAAPQLGPIRVPSLVVGQPWQLWLRGREIDGERPRIGMRGLPPGARLATSGTDGWHTLDWTPPPEAVGTLEITLVAIDRHEPLLTTERTLHLLIRPAEPGSEPRRAASGRAAEHISPDPLAEPLPAPTIETLPVQIVSTGHVVRLDVRARLDDGRPPRLKIDRLPAHASFDENPDGSRTFYWPTGEGDRGEHRFRITALHPDDDTRASSAEAIVLVDGSGRGTSEPGMSTVPAPTAFAPSSSAVTVDAYAPMWSADTDPSEYLDAYDLPGYDTQGPSGPDADLLPPDPQANVDGTYDPQDIDVELVEDYSMDDAPTFPAFDGALDEIDLGEPGTDNFYGEEDGYFQEEALDFHLNE